MESVQNRTIFKLENVPVIQKLMNCDIETIINSIYSKLNRLSLAFRKLNNLILTALQVAEILIEALKLFSLKLQLFKIV